MSPTVPRDGGPPQAADVETNPASATASSASPRAPGPNSFTINFPLRTFVLPPKHQLLRLGSRLRVHDPGAKPVGRAEASECGVRASGIVESQPACDLVGALLVAREVGRERHSRCMVRVPSSQARSSARLL